MKKRLTQGAAALAALAVVSGCGKKSSSDSASTTPTATSTDTNTSTTPASSTSGTAVVGSLALGITSLTSAVGGGGISSSGANLVDADAGYELASAAITWTAHDSECDPNRSGLPINTSDATNFPANAGLQGGSKVYNAAYFYCFFREPTADPSTVLGAMGQAVGFTCSLASQLTFDGKPHDVTIAIDDTCFPAAFVNMLKGAGIDTTSFPVTATASTTSFFGNTTGAWDSSLEVTGTLNLSMDGKSVSWPIDMQALISNKNNVFTYAKLDAKGFDASMDSSDAFVFSVDQTNGITRYEHRQAGYGADAAEVSQSMGGFNRHNRALIKGTMGTDGTFSKITDMEAEISNLWKSGFGDYTADVGAIKSFKGDPADGFWINTYDGPADGKPVAGTAASATPAYNMGSYYPTVSACTGKSGVACTGNTGIAFSANSDLAFLILPASQSTPGTSTLAWFNALVPPTFTSLTTADVQP